MANQEFTLAAAARAFMGRFSENLQHALSQSRPWLELIYGSSFASPESLSDATDRIRRNVSYFRINYALLFIAVFSITLVHNCLHLFLVCGLLAAFIFAYPPPLALFNRDSSWIEAFPVIAIPFVIVNCMISSALMFAAMLGVAIICGHAACRVPADLLLDAFSVPDDPCVNDEVPTGLLLDDPCANDERLAQCMNDKLLAQCVNDKVTSHLSLDDDPCANDERLAQLMNEEVATHLSFIIR